MAGDEAAQRGQHRRAERRHHRQHEPGPRERQGQRRRVGARQDDDRRETGPPPRGLRQPRGQRRQQERDRRRRHRRGFAQSRTAEKPARQVHLDRDGGHLADGRAQGRARGLGEHEHRVVAGQRVDPVRLALLDRRPRFQERNDLDTARPGAADEIDERPAARVRGNAQIGGRRCRERGGERQPEGGHGALAERQPQGHGACDAVGIGLGQRVADLPVVQRRRARHRRRDDGDDVDRLRRLGEQRVARGATAARRARGAQGHVEADDGGAAATERGDDARHHRAVPGPRPEARLARRIARDDDETRGVQHRRAGAEPAIVDRPVERGDAGASQQRDHGRDQRRADGQQRGPAERLQGRGRERPSAAALLR